MAITPLILDISEEYVYLHKDGRSYATEILVNDVFAHPELTVEAIKAEINNNNVRSSDVVFSVPVVCINHQLVSLPENVSDKEKLVFLDLEINKSVIGKRFGVHKLDVTKRKEGDQELCDYLILSIKKEVYERFEAIAKALSWNIKSIIPSFYSLGADRISDLRATAWIGDDRTEIVIWGKDNPLALSYLPNTGDQIGDVNRFIVEYFDHVETVNLSMVYLFGPKMRDSALGFGLTYPHMIFDDPAKYLFKNFHNVLGKVDISKAMKLPRAPLAMTPINITFIACAVAFVLLVSATLVTQALNFRLESQFKTLQRQEEKAINLDQSSKYIKEAQLLGTRDYEENNQQFSEFQISAKLRSPDGAEVAIAGD